MMLSQIRVPSEKALGSWDTGLLGIRRRDRAEGIGAQRSGVGHAVIRGTPRFFWPGM